jgi:hypothetical protein
MRREQPPLELYSSGDKDEMEVLDRILHEAPAVDITVVSQANLLKGRVPMPFIRHPDGSRTVGIDGIKRLLSDNA